MRKTSTLLYLWLSGIVLFSATNSHAQLLLWPGDINDNGIVNGKDVLRWGYANGATGPARPVGNGAAWTGLNVGLPWAESFPGETNFSYGDCDGNGVINLDDVNGPITDHFGNTHGIVQPDFCPIGDEDGSPPLLFVAEKESYPTGARIDLEVRLGTADLPVADFYGITFQLKYNRDLVRPGAVTYTAAENGWYDPSGTAGYTFFDNEVNSGTIELAVTRTNQEGVPGHGVLGYLSLILRGNIDIVLPGALNLEVDLVQMINSEMEIIPVYYDPDVTIVISGDPGDNCPDIIDPVCGSDGNTYINSCYAEAAGIRDYTQGVCYSDCIDPSLMRPDTDCETTAIDPVCGCNNITYSNPCLAEAAGVVNYTTGPCSNDPDDAVCYDPALVVQSNGTSVHEDSGVITLVCPTEDEPVCGCDGITYPNACTAEAAGIAFYTPGTCEDECIDPAAMDPEAGCASVYEPVCGCNDITYSNACIAEAAGITDYLFGVCGPNAAWCAEATPLSCGDYLAQETTIGYGNQISQYPGCVNQSYLGPDRVFVFDKTTAGDLQISLEILTPNIDLDLFLLEGSCSAVNCIGSSTNNNKKSNSEGIVLEDAPLGTYYIVVDARFADEEGRFRLEVNCGYLYCGNAVELNCGVPFSYNNQNGRDDVSLYTCGQSVLHANNNGPEVVHYFTTTSAGEVEINISGLSANLELYLLRDCDRGACIDYSKNPGTANETINTYLEPGTYYMVVDGYNGAVSGYNLRVDCQNTCALAFSNITATPSTCTTNDGAIEIAVTGGTPSYIISYAGPVSGNFSTSDNSYTISYLPAGTYRVSMIDARGCELEETVIVNSTGTLSATVSAAAAVCDEPGSIGVNLQGGTAPYRVYVSGPKEEDLLINIDNFTIPDLDPGIYELYILDAAGCSVTRQATVQEAESNFSFSLTPFPAGCGELGYVEVLAQNGSAPYSIQYSGPVSGNGTANNDAFKVTRLPGGTYSLTVRDANGCASTSNFTIGDINLELSTTVSNGICGRPGQILVQITNGTAGYTINWSGPASGSVNTSSDNHIIPNLPSGDYQIEVVDANQCTGFDVAEINNTGENLATTVQPVDGTCGENGAIRISINNGEPPYAINWTGPANGQTQITGTSFTIPGLPDGLYEVSISDNNDCQDQESVFVNIAPALAVSVAGFNGNCGQDGSIRVSMSSGQANYIISWEGPDSGSETATEDEFDITGLASGTYQVSVTDARGCTEVAVQSIENAEGLLLIDPDPQVATCEQPGSIALKVSGGEATYQVSWEGPVSGEAATDENGGLLIPDLIAGTYQLSAIDQNGCTGTMTAVVEADAGNVGISLSPQDPICTQPGRIDVTITNGSPEYSVSWEGPVNGVSATDASSFAIVDLPAGTYKVTVTDQFGCLAADNVTLTQTGDLKLTAAPVNAACGIGQINVQIEQGSPAFEISWDGPVTGSIITNSPNYTIPDLPDGTYDIAVSDLNGCNDAMQVSIFSGSLPAVIASPQPGICGANGAIGISISGGAPGFNVEWSGPISGSRQLSGNFFNIPDLPSGSYNVLLIDQNGCQDEAIVELANQTTDLDVSVGLIENECGQENTIALNISGGVAEFEISWTGPQNGSRNTTSNNPTISDLPAGTYDIVVTDANTCSVQSSIAVPLAPVDLLSVTANPGLCGQTGSIRAEISGGTPDYTISWTGPVSGSMTDSDNVAEITGLPSGTYSVVLTDAAGCSETEVIELNNDENSPALTLELVENECGLKHNIQVTISGGEPSYLINWNGPTRGAAVAPGSSYVIENLTEGMYNINITDQNDCTASQNIEVVEETLDILRLRAEPGTCGDLGQIRVTITGGEPDYDINWTGPAEGNVSIDGQEYFIPELPAGEYLVSLTDINGCTDTRAVVLAEATNLEAAIQGMDGSCTASPVILVEIASGSPGYSISWTGPVSGTLTTTNSSRQIEGLVAGTYEVSVKDALGCEIIETITVAGGDSDLAVNVIGQNGTCGESGLIAIDISGGDPDFDIAWSGPVSGAVSIDENAFLLDNLPDGDYTITVSDQNGCSEPFEITILNQPDIEATFTAVPGNCGNPGNIRIDFSGVPPFTVAWDGPDSGSEGVNNDFYAIPDLASGSYAVTVTDQNGCSYDEIIELDNGTNDLTFEAITSNVNCSQPGSIALSISGGAADYVISWNGPQNGSITTSDNDPIIPDLPAGAYEVMVTDAAGCSQTKVVTVNNEENSLNVALELVANECGLKHNIQVTISGGEPSYMINWTGPDQSTTTISDNVYVIKNLTEGTYNVNITDQNGCTASQDIEVAEETLDILSLLAEPGTCGEPGGIRATITGGEPDYDISWTGPAEGNISIDGQEYFIPDLPAGEYLVTIADINGCTDTRAVVLPEAPNLEATIQGMDGSCTASPVILVEITSGSPGYSISWTGPVSGMITAPDASQQIDGLVAGTYEVSIQDVLGCIVTETITVTGGDTDLSVNVIGQNGTCGESGLIAIDISGGDPNFDINWSGPTSGTVSIDETTFSLDNLPDGTYMLTVSDQNGCSEQFELTILNQPDIEATFTAAPGNCGNPGSIGIDFSGAPPFTVAWDGPGSGLEAVNNDFYAISDLASGSYTVTVTDQNGCSYDETIDLDNGINDLTFDAVPSSGNCSEPGSIALSISGGMADFLISWTGPQNDNLTTSDNAPTIPDLPAGTYEITIMDATGCSQTKIVTLNNAESSLNVTLTLAANECGQQHNIRVMISGGSPSYQINWSGPQMGNAATPGNGYEIEDLPEGTYNVTVTDQNGCSFTQSIKVIEEALNILRLRAEPGTCGEPGGIRVTITGGEPNYNISWDGPAEGNVSISEQEYFIPELPAGEYLVSLDDINGCTTNRSVVLQEVSKLEATIQGVDGTCTDPPVILVDIGIGSPGYSISWTGPVSGMITTTDANRQIDGLVAGTYEVAIEDDLGCTVTETITVTGGDSDLSVNIIGQNGICGENGLIAIDISGGNPNFAISWSGPVSGAANIDENAFLLDNLPDGNYALTVSDQNGCSEQFEITILNQVDIEAIITAVSGSCGNPGSIRVDFSGAPPFTIAWDGPGNGSENVDDSFYAIPDLVSGMYTLKVTDQNGCSYEETIELDNGTNDLDFTTTTTNGGCNQAGSIALDISGGQADYTIDWSGGTQGSVTVAGDHTLTDLQGGTYIIKVTDQNGCTAEKSVELLSPGNTITLETSLLHPSCDNKGSITLNISGDHPDFDISWIGPVLGSATMGTGSFIIPDLDAGVYSINVTDMAGCSRNANVTLTDANEVPSASFEHTTEILTGIFNSSGTVGSYLWNFGDGNTSAEEAPRYEYCDPGAYTVCLTVSNDCGEDTYCNVVSVSIPNDLVLLEVGDLEIPAGSQVQIPVTVRQLGQLVSLEGSLAPDNAAVAQVMGLSPGLIDPQYIDAEKSFTFFQNDQEGVALQDNDILFYIDLQATGTPGQSTFLRLTDEPKKLEVGGLDNGLAVPVPHFALKGQITITEPLGISVAEKVSNISCAGAADGEIALTIQYDNEYSVQWTGPDFSSSSETINNLAPGTYEVIILGADGTSIYESSIQITEPDPLTISAINTLPARCDTGRGSATVALNGGTAPFTYDIGNGPGSADQLDDLTPGAYALTLVDANGCSTSESFSIEGPDVPIVDLGPTRTICPGETTTLTPGTYESYLWSTGSTSPVIALSQPGIYSVTVTNTAGCQGSASIEVQVSGDLPEVDLGPPVQLCAGEVITLNAGSYSSYLWSNGATSESIAVSEPGFYSLTVTNESGCEGTGSIQVQAGGEIDIPDFGSNLQLCPGETLMLSGGEYATYNWSTGANTQSIPVTEAGVYSLTVTNAGGCSISASVQISSAGGSLNLELGPDRQICSGETITLNGGTFATYNWSNGAGSSSIVVSEPGTYTLTVTNAGGCEAVDAVEVTSVERVQLLIENDFLDVCPGESIELMVSGAQTYNWVDTSGTLSALNIANPMASPDTTVSYRVIGSSTCGSDTVDLEVFVHEVIATAGPDTCIGPGNTARLTAYGGVSYLWESNPYPVSDPLSSSTTARPDDSTTYVVAITDINGCVIRDSLTVLVANDPEGAITAVNLITPNGDERNDVLYFPNIDKFGQNSLKVFNRWGNLVYQKVNYQSDEERFDGTYRGKELPAGTYYYMLSFRTGEIRQKLTILR